MPDAKTQADIVNQTLAAEGIGETVTDKLRIPAVKQCFRIEIEGQAQKTDIVRLPLTSTPQSSTRQELAEALVQCLSYRPHVVGLGWEVGGHSAAVTYTQGGEVEVLASLEELRTIIEIILKARANMASFNWDFSQPYIEVTYQNTFPGL